MLASRAPASIAINSPSPSHSGTLTGPSQVQKIVNVNGRNLELRAEGLNLIASYADQPGSLGKIGTILGNEGIDIQAAALSQDADGPGATVLLRVSVAVSEQAQAAIRDAVAATTLELVDLS